MGLKGPNRGLKGPNRGLKGPDRVHKGLNGVLKSPSRVLKGPIRVLKGPNMVLKGPRDCGRSYHISIHHEDGDLPVGGPLDLLPHDGVDLHYLVGQPLEVQEGSHFAAEWTCLVLVQGQLQTLRTMEGHQGYCSRK